MKKILSLVIAGILLISAATAETTDTSIRDMLVNSITDGAVGFLNGTTVDYKISAGSNWSVADTLPASFDLRERGIVPPVRNQGNWGTCWGFAAISAAEISLLSTLNLTTEQFAELYGQELNLSERHLAWFGTGHLPLLDEYPEGEYPYELTQAGEGLWHDCEETDPDKAHYFAGGFAGYASSIFSNSIGPVWEYDFPYQSNQGTLNTEDDWSLPEDARYFGALELKNSAILPSPASRDENGSYVYDPAATEAIKQELIAGRAVHIIYHADESVSPEAKAENYKKQHIEDGYAEDVADTLSRLEAGIITYADMTKTQVSHMIIVMAYQYGYDPSKLTKKQSKALYKEVASFCESLAASCKESSGVDNFYNYKTNSQYIDNTSPNANHAVTIVGWIDDFSASNFVEDHQPDAPGAWIVRNSWGEDSMDNGYFYLSYYDHSIAGAETYEFSFNSDSDGGIITYAYDNMQTSGITSSESETPIYSANIFTVDTDSVLRYVGLMTADYNTTATVAIYLLNEDFTSPVDGILLDTVTDQFTYGGYHRLALNHGYGLPAGAVISVVQRQRVDTAEGTHYDLPFTTGYSEELINAWNEEVDMTMGGMTALTWAKACIGEGESMVGSNNEWFDWKDIVEEARSADTNAYYVEIDNINLKAFFYTLDSVCANHKFGPAMNYNGGADIMLCEECGEALILQK